MSELTTTFIILKITYEYNDEYHYVLDFEPGIPFAVCDDKAMAESMCEELENEEWKTVDNLFEWCGYDYQLEDEERARMVQAFPELELDEDFELDALSFPSGHVKTAEQIALLRKIFCDIVFHRVIESPVLK